MNTNPPVKRRKVFLISKLLRARWLIAVQLCAVLLALTCTHAPGQTAKRQKLPSPEKIVNDYLKAIGGKKLVVGIKDATYEWGLMEKGNDYGQSLQVRRAKSYLKAPSAIRTDISSNKLMSAGGSGAELKQTTQQSEQTTPMDVELQDDPQTSEAATARSAWISKASGMHVTGNGLRTLTDAEANVAKLQAMLEASHFIDYKKQNVLARTVALDESGDESAYIVEFSLRNGARLRYWFGTTSKLLLKSTDEVRQMTTRFQEYKPERGLLEPHQVERTSGHSASPLILRLQSVSYNAGLADSLFDPPGGETIDIGALLREVDRNQEQVDERVSDYTYTEKLTEHKINDKGEVTEETVKVFEVYPVPGREDVRKLISENGVALSADKAAKEDKRVMEEMEKVERERTKAAEKRERDRAKGKKEKPTDDDPGIGDFLRSAELVSPRRERLRDRDTIVFDFRPRVGYKPKGDIESIVSKLTGVVWIDPVDKQVMRLEARLIESYKMGGGLLASVRPGTAFVFEQKRMDDGVWLPVYTQANISAKILLFKGINLNVMEEFSNYQRFKGDVNDYKLSAPEDKDKPASQPQQQPPR